MASLTDLDAHALASMIRAREVTSAEVAGAHLQRIADCNPQLRAVIAMDETAVRSAARAADDTLARGDAVGRLHGVPFTVKDWIETHDLPCSGGVEERRTFVPARDATVVARMRAAGAILLGKTKPGTDDAVYPRARNPYDLARSTGGSSAGEAAIIAARGSPIGLGSDSGGSLRLPSAWCGIATLKPTAGLVPVTGHFPRVGGMADPRTQIGPMARSVDDLSLVFSVIAGPDGRDPDVVPMPLRDPAEVVVPGLRVAICTEVSGIRPTGEVSEAVSAAANALAAAGAVVSEARPPRVDEVLAITKTYWARTRSIAASEWRPYRPSTVSADDIEQSIFAWDRFRREMAAFMANWGLVLTPATPWPAPRIGDERVEDFIYTLPFSLTGQPAAVVRAGTSGEGLPIGVQIAARSWRDDVALSAAKVIEDVLGGWQPPTL